MRGRFQRGQDQNHQHAGENTAVKVDPEREQPRQKKAQAKRPFAISRSTMSATTRKKVVNNSAARRSPRQ